SMIGELLVRAGKFKARHVASDAVLSGDTANVSGAFGRAGSVARLALGIIGGGDGLDIAVRIVAGGAADAAVGGIVAFAVVETVWLEPDVLDSARAVDRNLRPGAVALPTEV